jgi:hypothetical protein
LLPVEFRCCGPAQEQLSEKRFFRNLLGWERRPQVWPGQTAPQLSYPMPENSCFVAEVDERPVVDVLFEFYAESERPYNLYFNVSDELDYQNLAGDPKLEAFKQMKIYSRSTL